MRKCIRCGKKKYDDESLCSFCKTWVLHHSSHARKCPKCRGSKAYTNKLHCEHCGIMTWTMEKFSRMEPGLDKG